MSVVASFDDVSVLRGTTPVLQHLSLELKAGERWGVLGPNGAGKSTLLQTALGLLRPSSGRITVAGVAPDTATPASLARLVAWVPQQFPSDLPHSVLEVVQSGRAPFVSGFGVLGPGDDTAVEHALEATGLRTLAARPFSQLSGGQQRLVFLARALAQTPKLLLLDEPLAFLDAKHQTVVWAAIERAAATGTAVMCVLHDVGWAPVFDKLLLLKEGRSVRQGSVSEALGAAALEETFGVRFDEASTSTGRRLWYVASR